MEAVEEGGGDVLREPCGDGGGGRSGGAATQLRSGLHPGLRAVGPRLSSQGGVGDRQEFPSSHPAIAGINDKKISSF